MPIIETMMPSGTPNVSRARASVSAFVVPELHAPGDAPLIDEQRPELVPWLGGGGRGDRACHALGRLDPGEQRMQLAAVEAVRLHHVGDELLHRLAQGADLVGGGLRGCGQTPGPPRARRAPARRIHSPAAHGSTASTVIDHAARARPHRRAGAFQVAALRHGIAAPRYACSHDHLGKAGQFQSAAPWPGCRRARSAAADP